MTPAGGPAAWPSLALDGEGPAGIAFWRVASADDQAVVTRDLSAVIAPVQDRPGRIGAALHRSLDGERIALYLRAVDEDRCRAWLQEAARIAEPSDLDLFTLAIREPAQHRGEVTAGDRVALGEFWVKPGGLDALLAREPQAARTAITDFGIVSAHFHVSTDGRRVVNYAQIRSPETVARLAASSRFDATTGYWRELARNEHHVYDVVLVVAPPSPTPIPLPLLEKRR